jgi:hypothetical protein
MKYLASLAVALMLATPCFGQNWDPVGDALRDRPRGSDIRRQAREIEEASVREAEAQRQAGEQTSRAIIIGAAILGVAIVVAVVLARKPKA